MLIVISEVFKLYCSYLLPKAIEGDVVSKTSFWVANFKLVYVFAKDFKVPRKHFDDFSQQCYLAYERTLATFNIEAEATFLSYYRRWVLHYYYVWKLHSNYATSLSVYQDQKLTEGEHTQLRSPACLDKVLSFQAVDESLTNIEDSLLAKTLWEEVDRILAEDDFYLISRVYCDNSKLKDVGIELGMCASTVKTRHRRALQKLRGSTILREIARDLLGI